MASPRPDANGHRRRQLRLRVLSEETRCALCDKPVDKALGMKTGEHGPKCGEGQCAGCIPHPLRPEVDEDLPRSRGGSPYDRNNCRLMHRKCNRWKSDMTLAEARKKLHGTTGPAAPVKASPIW
jgi:5-methylcytosine-specific restriction endonuclease McrA